ncbi:unnamed protein product [Angiostrongylus costaricensis]|uniref:Reverse transcriptase domain-containing protein n=1 Tax=Angiostrongylus costaricensis TaxID=334426 RepID=A0A0R3PX43_ANGCS|nr:unnamed protein product [Angiostrongylus costaricensis]
MEALDSQGVLTQCTKILRELHKNFTSKIAPFYNDINIDVIREFRQGDTISSKLFTATIENVMRTLEWDNMGLKFDDRQLHHLGFEEDVVFITSNISQAERMLADFDKACGKTGLRMNLTKTMFMRNRQLCLSWSENQEAAWGAFKSIEKVLRRTKNTRLRAHFFDSTVLPALTYALETWSLRKQDETSLSVIERAVERTMLGVSSVTQVGKGIRSFNLQRLKIKDPVLYVEQSNTRWARHVMRVNDNQWTRAVSDRILRDFKRRPPIRWSEFFTKNLEEGYDTHRVPRASKTHWATLARDREKWKIY